MSSDKIEIGQIWVWKKPDGLYAGTTLKLRVDEVIGDYIYYKPKQESEKTDHNKPLKRRSTEEEDEESAWFGNRVQFRFTHYGESKESTLLKEGYLKISKETLLLHGFRIDGWEDWPLAEPTMVSSRLDEIE